MIEALEFRVKWGVWALAIYGFLIGVVLFYFNTRHSVVSKHYVKKNTNRIEVALASAPKVTSTPPTQPKSALQTPPKAASAPPKKKIQKQPQKHKEVVKKVVKEKVVKRVKPPTKLPKEKKVIKKPTQKAKDLFSQLQTKKREKKKVSSKEPLKKVSPKERSASDRVRESLKKEQQREQGIENAYFAKLEEKLRGWPAQSEYAGESAKVLVKIKSSGQFTFRVISSSSSQAFNDGLIAYLKQLQRFGLGRHSGGKVYSVSVEFVAVE